MQYTLAQFPTSELIGTKRSMPADFDHALSEKLNKVRASREDSVVGIAGELCKRFEALIDERVATPKEKSHEDNFALDNLTLEFDVVEDLPKLGLVLPTIVSERSLSSKIHAIAMKATQQVGHQISGRLIAKDGLIGTWKVLFTVGEY